MITRWDVFGDKRSVSLCYSVDSPARPRSKSMVRGHILSMEPFQSLLIRAGSGYIMELDENQPEFISLTMCAQIDSKQKLPAWVQVILLRY